MNAKEFWARHLKMWRKHDALKRSAKLPAPPSPSPHLHEDHQEKPPPRPPQLNWFKRRWQKRFLGKPRSWMYRATVLTLYWGTICAIWFALILVSAVTIYTLTAEDPFKAGLANAPAKLTIRAQDGRVIAEKGLRRNHMPLEKMPPHLINAVLTTEDRRFYYHYGFDPLGIIRALRANRRAGEVVQGGSTITQQLVKVLFLRPDRTYWRKIEEVLLALSLEWRFNKKQILELYLNRIYFGGGNYGVEAAAQQYFGKSVSKLSLYEAAIIAGLIKSPSYYAPTQNLQRSLDRGKLVLQNMLNASIITQAEYDQALANPPSLRTYLPSESYGYVIDWVMQLVSDFSQNGQEDLIIDTTIDYELQGAAQSIVKQKMDEQGAQYNAGEAAAVIVDMQGAVKALVGGRDYTKNQFNRAVHARRQPGSAFKPFVYLTALEKGLTPDSLVHDGPIQIGNWTPNNYNDRYYGDVTLRQGLAQSLNTVAVRLCQWAGRENVIATAHRLGIRSPIQNNPSIALGTSEVSPLEITTAYVPFANGGFATQPHIIKSIRTDKGQVLFKLEKSNPSRVIHPQLVVAMNDMLIATINYGTGQQASLYRHTAAGKTGTGQSYRDAWFIGYTAHYVTGVWIGNDDFAPMKRITGGSLPTLIWHDIMVYAHLNKQPLPLPGGGVQEARSWVPPQRGGGSFLDELFGGSSSVSDPILGTPAERRPSRRSERSWFEDLFGGN